MTRIRRMLVPTDFSATSNLALTYAADLAVRFNASIHLLHVVDDLRFTSSPEGYFADLPLMRDQLIITQDQLNEAAARIRASNIECTAQAISGRPSATIVREALDRGTDLIVMGTHGRSGVAHFIIGSVAERVVRTAPCPVLTVRDTARVADTLAADRANEPVVLKA